MTLMLAVAAAAVGAIEVSVEVVLFLRPAELAVTPRLMVQVPFSANAQLRGGGHDELCSSAEM